MFFITSVLTLKKYFPGKALNCWRHFEFNCQIVNTCNKYLYDNNLSFDPRPCKTARRQMSLHFVFVFVYIYLLLELTSCSIWPPIRLTTLKICFHTTTRGHFPSQSYKTFFPSEAGFSYLLSMVSGSKHMRLWRNHIHSPRNYGLPKRGTRDCTRAPDVICPRQTNPQEKSSIHETGLWLRFLRERKKVDYCCSLKILLLYYVVLRTPIGSRGP